MRYLYGDATPAPFGLNLLAVLRGFLAFGAYVVAAEPTQLGHFERDLERFLEDASAAGPQVADVARRVMSSARDELSRARSFNTLIDRFGIFAARHDLPGGSTQAHVEINGDVYAVERRRNIGSIKLAWGLSLALPGDHAFLGPITAGALVDGLAFDAYTVQRLEVQPSKTRVILRSDEGAHCDIVFGGARVIVMTAAADGDAQTTLAQGEELERLRALGGALNDLVAAIPLGEPTLSWATLDGESLDAIGEPAALIASLVSHLAPLVKQLRKRSQTTGELALIAEDDAGRNELSVRESELAAFLAGLTAKQRAVFRPLRLPKPNAKSQPRVPRVFTATDDSTPQPKIFDVEAAKEKKRKSDKKKSRARPITKTLKSAGYSREETLKQGDGPDDETKPYNRVPKGP